MYGMRNAWFKDGLSVETWEQGVLAALDNYFDIDSVYPSVEGDREY